MADLNIMPKPRETKTTHGNPTERVRRLIESPDTFGTVLLILCLDAWPDCLGDPDDPDRGPWHPATFRAELEQRFGANVPSANIHKLMAAVTILTTDLFFKNVRSFIPLANVLAGDEFSPDVWEPADSVECAWAITEALLLDPPDDGDPEPFVDEIRYYIGAVLKEEGFVTPPDVLRIALGDDFADRVTFEFADDPEMFQGIYEVQRSKTAEVEAVLRDQLLDLKTQLAALPLQEGQTRELEERIDQMLKLNAPEEPAGPESLI